MKVYARSLLDLNNMHQDRDEPVSAHCARLHGQANVCKYTIMFPNCHNNISYREPILRNALCRRIKDTEIQLDLFGHTNQDMALEVVLHFVEE